VGQRSRERAAEGRGKHRYRRKQSCLREGKPELRANRPDRERVKHHVEAVEKPAEVPGEEHEPLRARDLHISTSSKRITSRGLSCPTAERSLKMMQAICGYPPVSCCSTKRMVGFPSAEIWIVPFETAEVITSGTLPETALPSSRSPSLL